MMLTKKDGRKEMGMRTGRDHRKKKRQRGHR